MKKLKIIFILFIAVSLPSCSDGDSKTIAFDFSVANVSGSYKLKTLTANLTNTAVTQGVVAPISTATEIGDTFNANLTLNANGTFNLKGNYRIVTAVTPTGGSTTNNAEIIILDDSGTYTINAQTRTISFASTNTQLLEGEYKVTIFSETTLSLTQASTEVNGGITTKTDATIVFDKQ
ncbi:MAG: hypothetical protein WAO74_01140 [Polaribacter sp.]|uniref:hypothetical protein n=1 Tax=Polaribacter sp. TaxID=1920175 RepID=UPI003BAFEF95